MIQLVWSVAQALDFFFSKTFPSNFKVQPQLGDTNIHFLKTAAWFLQGPYLGHRPQLGADAKLVLSSTNLVLELC